jgi:homoserine O-acetyltransferase
MKRAALLSVLLAACVAVAPARAGDFARRSEGDWVAPEFRFHTGAVLSHLRLHYVTLGAPGGEPVLILHGTAGSAASMLGPNFGGVLFSPGGVLDPARYYVILPDILGAGQSAKPSDGLRAGFPAYDYADMVLAEYRLVTEGLGVHHLRLVLGNSMGGMHTWLWGVTYPDAMDALVPLAAQPTEMAGRNWMLRRMLVESIRRDPAYAGGTYTAQPPSLRLANVFYGLATSGGTLGLQAAGATHAMADAVVDQALALPPPRDANDFIYQWDASRDYDPSGLLGRIAAPVLAINSADDERNPPQTGLMEQAMTRVKGGTLYLIPASATTHGHGTTSFAKFWADRLATFLAAVPKRAAQVTAAP